ncbi:hypothetical protein LINPERHAP2_LOCUS23008, partial [Linum perenne]
KASIIEVREDITSIAISHFFASCVQAPKRNLCLSQSSALMFTAGHCSYSSFNLHSLPQFSTPSFTPFPVSTLIITRQNYAPPLRITTTKLFAAKLSQNVSEEDVTKEVEVEVDEGGEEDYGEGDEFLEAEGFRVMGLEDDKGYDRDPELAEIMGSCLVDPEKAQSKMEERMRRKRNKIIRNKTGSSTPMKVTFNKFDFTNSYIWFEFYNIPLEKDISLICDILRSWHIIGRLGGCNSMNMQLSQSTFGKNPKYDHIQGANVTPTTFYNIGDFELQDNLGRICNVGIKQLVFGGSEFDNWKDGFTSEDAGCSFHKI